MHLAVQRSLHHKKSTQLVTAQPAGTLPEVSCAEGRLDEATSHLARSLGKGSFGFAA